MKYLIGAFLFVVAWSQLGATGDVTFIKPDSGVVVIPCAQAAQVATIAINNGAWSGAQGEMLSVSTWVVRGTPNVCKMRASGKDTLTPAQFNSQYPDGARVLSIEQ